MPNIVEYIAIFNRSKLNCAAYSTTADCLSNVAICSRQNNYSTSTENNRHIVVPDTNKIELNPYSLITKLTLIYSIMVQRHAISIS